MQVEHVERQLAADDDDRPADADPAPIARHTADDAGGFHVVFERLVADRVVDGHDVAVHVDRVRHVHIATERAAHAFGNHRLAVAGRSVEEHGLAGVDRRAEVLEHVVVDDEMREAAAQPFAIDVASRGLQGRASA